MSPGTALVQLQVQHMSLTSTVLPQEAGLSLELSGTNTYEQVSSRLASALTPPLEDPSMIRFTQQNNYTQQPKPQHLRFPQQEMLLPEMLSQHFGQTSDTLYYEVLDLPLQELERLKTLKVSNGIVCFACCNKSCRFGQVGVILVTDR